MSERRGFSGTAWLVVSALWFLSGIAGAVYRARNLHNADGIVLGFLLFAFAAFLVPIIHNLELPGGTKIEFDTEVKESASTLERELELAVTDIAQLLRSFIATETRIAAVYRMGAMNRATAYGYALTTIRDAMSASTRWLVPQERSADGDDATKASKEELRLTLWTWDEQRKQLIFVAGTVTPDQATALAGIGLMVDDDDYIGDAWRRTRISNHAGAPPEWRALSGGKNARGVVYPDARYYEGVMFVPVIEDGKAVGLIEIDREKRVLFDANAQIVASALADLISSIMTHQLVRWGRV